MSAAPTERDNYSTLSREKVRLSKNFFSDLPEPLCQTVSGGGDDKCSNKNMSFKQRGYYIGINSKAVFLRSNREMILFNAMGEKYGKTIIITLVVKILYLKSRQ